MAEEWIQYVSPFVSPDVSAEDPAEVFARLLGSRFFHSVGDLTLAELRPFTAPGVEDLLQDLPPEEACAAVAEAHARSATDRAAGAPERSLERLAKLVEQTVQRRQKRGELVPAADVAELKDEFARLSAENSDLLREKEASIRTLRHDLAAARKHQRWSLLFHFERLKGATRRGFRWLVGWSRAHPVRLCLGLSLLLGGLALTVAGYGGSIVEVATLLSLVVSWLSVGPREAARNVKRWLGMEEE